MMDAKGNCGSASRIVHKAVGDSKFHLFFCFLSLHLPDCVTLPPRIILSVASLRRATAELARADDVI